MLSILKPSLLRGAGLETHFASAVLFTVCKPALLSAFILLVLFHVPISLTSSLYVFEHSGFFVVAALHFLCLGFCWATLQIKRLVLIVLAQQASLFFDFRPSTVSAYSRAFGMIILERIYFSVCDECFRMTDDH